MSAPDPQTVCDLAQKVADIALHDTVHVDQWITAVLISTFGEDDLETRVAYHTAVARRLAVAKPAWLGEESQDGDVRSYPDSHSPWSQWLTQQLLDRGWLASDLVKASGNVLTAKQVSRWLHSQEVPDPGEAAIAGKALGGVVIGALHAAGHGDVADGLVGEAEQPQDERDGAVKLARRAPCDRITYVADQLEAAITDLRGLPGVSRARVVLAASVASLRELADVVLELEVEQDERDGDVRAAAANVNAVLGGTYDGRLRIHCPACEQDIYYPSLDLVSVASIVREHCAGHAAALEARDAKAGEGQ